MTTKEQPFEPDLLTVPETADHLRVTERTVWRLIAAGELRPCRIRRRVRIARAELENYLRPKPRPIRGSTTPKTTKA